MPTRALAPQSGLFFEVLNYFFTGEYTQKEIAELVGRSAVTIGKIIRSDQGRQYLNKLNAMRAVNVANVKGEWLEILYKHRKLPDELLNDPMLDPKLRVKLLMNIADRVGLAPGTEINSMVNKPLSPAEIRRVNAEVFNNAEEIEAIEVFEEESCEIC